MPVISQTIKYDNSRQRHLAIGLLLLVGALIACYIYLVNSTIFKAVSRQNDLDKLAALESKVVDLEGAYLELSSGITLERAYSLGFNNAESQTLVYGANRGTKLASRSE